MADLPLLITSSPSVVLKGNNFDDPALGKRGLNSGNYQLPQRKPRSRGQRNQSSHSIYANTGPPEVSYREIIESRPPLRPDLSTPGPWTYSPHLSKPLNETNAPSFSLRARCWPEKDVGGRTSWSKTWFQSPEVWTTKSNFQSDRSWPNPQSYEDKVKIGGHHQPSYKRYPAHTIGQKAKITFFRAGTENEPSPVAYDKSKADKIVFHRSPTIIHSFKPRNSNPWVARETTPAPCAYSPRINFVTSFRHQPAFSVGRASREGLEPLLGPYSSN